MEFCLKIDDIFKKIWLVQKKMYIGINTKGNLIIKGLPIIKHSASQLSQKILETLKPEINQKQDIKFSREYIEELITSEIQKDISIVGQFYNVKNKEDYKSQSSIQAQVSSVHGEGNHILIPNNKIGAVGKSKKYCTVEESKMLKASDLYLDKVWNELNPFIK